MALGVIGIYFLSLFLKKYLIRRREKRFVQRVVEQSDVLSEGERPETQSILDLERSWKTNLNILKKSYLRKKGNPLYAVPWYLAMGESGAGKTTMLVNAGVRSSFTELEDLQGRIGATRNCDWFFFDQAVVLDSAGRYSVPLASNQELNEWQRFLLLLAKSRRKEPLNGIILFVAVDTLLTDDPSTLKKKAQVLRNRIHSMMRMIGYKIPICIMVTKMDTVPGFTEFVGLLPEEQRNEAMGFSADSNSHGWQDLLEQTFESITNAVRKIRLLKISQPEGRKPSFFSLVNQFDPIKERLVPFLDTLFTENNYQETPFIKGIFFGSGTCSQSPQATFLSQLDTASLVGKNIISSAFTGDLLTKVLPGIRWSFTPVKEFVLWRTVTRRLGLVTWLCLLFFVGGLIGLSYFHNYNILTTFPTKKETVSQHEPGSNAAMVILEKMRLNILDLEKRNNRWRLPFQVYRTVDRSIAAYKNSYCHLFKSTILTPMEERFEHAVDVLDVHTSESLYAEYVGYVVEQIEFLQQQLSNKKVSEVPGFESMASAVLTIQNPALISDVAKFFPNLNAAYLDWNGNESEERERLTRLQSTLKELLLKNRGEVSWLYADSISDTPNVTLADFWHSRSDNKGSYVPGAFTEKGRKNIGNFLQAIKKAGMEQEAYKDLQVRYRRSYVRQFVYWWQKFAEEFAEGELALDSDFQWRETAIFMTSPGNPYFSLLARMSSELQGFNKDTAFELPIWGKTLIGLDKIRQLAVTAQNNKQGGGSSLIPKLSSEASRLQTEVLQKVDPSQSAAMDEELKMAQAWEKYKESLKGLDAITPYKEKAAGAFTAWFKDAGSEKGDTLFGKSYSALVSLKTIGKSKYPSELIWKLVYGPFTFLEDFAAYHTAEVLQEKWQEEVQAAITGVDPGKVNSVLFEKEKGAVWLYLQKYGAPFVEHSVNGFKARQVYGRSLNFSPVFYTFLNQATHVVVNEQPNYTVTFETTPIEVNEGAKIEPLYATFSLKCAKKNYSLENDNFPRTMTIDWTPDKCGDVTLQIGLPSLELKKVWSGRLALAHFLESFQAGFYHFTEKDFPEQQGYLSSQSISYISIGYNISGDQDVVHLLAPSPDQTPKHIINPIDQRSVEPHQLDSDMSTQPRPLELVDPTPKATISKPAASKQTTAEPPQSKTIKKDSSKYHEESWLLKQNKASYTVQFMSLTAEASVTRGLALLSDDKDKAVYRKVIGNIKWYVLCSGIFSSKDEAVSYKDSLPQDIIQAHPIIRKIGRIQDEIKQQDQSLPRNST